MKLLFNGPVCLTSQWDATSCVVVYALNENAYLINTTMHNPDWKHFKYIHNISKMVKQLNGIMSLIIVEFCWTVWAYLLQESVLE